MQTRFGIVLLVLVSMMGFMLGRSVKSQFGSRHPDMTASGTSRAGVGSPATGGARLNTKGHESTCVECHLDRETLKKTAAAGKAKKSALQSGAG